MSIFNYLQKLNTDDINILYKNKWACKSVFRSLSELEKQFLLSFLFTSETISMEQMSSIVIKSPESEIQFKNSMHNLHGLGILLQEVSGHREYFKINEVFQKTFIICLQEDEEEEIEEEKETDDSEASKPPKASSIEKHSNEKWESILLYVARGTGTDNIGFHELLKKANLVATNEKREIEITNEGFNFLLQDRKTQIWIVLQQYLEDAEKNGLIKSEVLQFLFELSFMESGGTKGYSFQSLTKTQKVFIADLTEFGIIYQRSKDKKKEENLKKYYPTSVAIGLIYSGDESNMDWNIKDQGNIIVETNYKLYAYTNSPLEIAILSIFVELQYRTPNLVVGLISRKSIREALTSGITSKQIIDYLYKHSHPQMRKRTPILPETVCEQIILWEREIQRVSMEEGILYYQFPSVENFRLIENETKKKGIYLWSDIKKSTLIIKSEGYDLMNEVMRFYQ
eukprot:gene3002-5012_t